jgi:hypothetical protein
VLKLSLAKLVEALAEPPPVIPGFTLVQRKPGLSLVIDENFTLLSTYLEASVLNFL